jgi:hypothetical protein
MRRVVVVAASAVLAFVGSRSLLGQDRTTTPANALDEQRRNIRTIADSLKDLNTAGDTTVAKRWKVARTAWGDPDLDGVYTNNDEWGIPFDSITTQELGTIRETRRDAFLERLASQAPAEPGTVGWYDTLNVRNSRPWLIVDPPDGHIPALTPQGRRRADAAAEQQSRGRAMDSYADRSAYERCISRGFPGSMIPETYGNAYQIHQSPGSIAIRYEQIHETRVVPLDSRPHVGSAVRSYMGDARGRWDGDTLVVETTNFRGDMTLSSSASRGAFQGFDAANLRLTERFARIGERTVEWSVKVEDSSTWVRPWTFAMRLAKVDSSQQPYEYACHEGNYGIRNALATARAAEKAQRGGRP